MKNTLHVADFRIRHVSAGGSAYAVNMANGEQVFIGSHLLMESNPVVGDLFRCACEENTKDSDVHWYALVVEPVWEEE